ncbi:MAG: xylulose kinase, partial [Propionibacteriales bacterium]|nr:xylulose kinase [Propionibacteriales bacterium]
MAKVVGVDSSTQSCKVVVRDAQTGALLSSGRASHPDGSEVDPKYWLSALDDALAQAGDLSDVVAMSIAGQQHGMVVLDRDGRVIRPALLWNDTRSAGAAEDLIAEVGADEYAQRTGLVPVASFTATKLRWLRDNEPANAARVAAVCLPHDWLTWRLRGYGPAGEAPLGPDLTALITDRSDASGTAYYSAATGTYDTDLLVRALGHNVIVPQVLGADVGCSGPGFVVGPGAGDNAAAALGLNLGIGDVVVSLGTSGTVFACTATPSADASGIVAGFADATGAYLPL